MARTAAVAKKKRSAYLPLTGQTAGGCKTEAQRDAGKKKGPAQLCHRVRVGGGTDQAQRGGEIPRSAKEKVMLLSAKEKYTHAFRG